MCAGSVLARHVLRVDQPKSSAHAHTPTPVVCYPRRVTPCCFHSHSSPRPIYLSANEHNCDNTFFQMCYIYYPYPSRDTARVQRLLYARVVRFCVYYRFFDIVTEFHYNTAKSFSDRLAKARFHYSCTASLGHFIFLLHFPMSQFRRGCVYMTRISTQSATAVATPTHKF